MSEKEERTVSEKEERCDEIIARYIEAGRRMTSKHQKELDQLALKIGVVLLAALALLVGLQWLLHQ